LDKWNGWGDSPYAWTECPYEEAEEMEQFEQTVVDSIVTHAGFTVTDDKSAEWALKKIRIEQLERDRIVAACEEMIKEYQFIRDKAKEVYEDRTGYFKNLLLNFFRGLSEDMLKRTKTQATYKLPSGKLKLKIQGPEYGRDEVKLIEWARVNHPALIKVNESLDWESMKKMITICGENVVDGTGEIIDGVRVVERPDKFEVEI